MNLAARYVYLDDPAKSDPAEATKLNRLTGPEVRARVLARIREPVGELESAPPGADWITRVKAAHRAHVHADFVAARGGPASDDVICVWQIDGARREGGKTIRFRLDLWLARDPTAKTLEPEPLG